MHSALEELVGKKIEIRVGEPWDFVGPDGANRIVGRVTNVISELRIVIETRNRQRFGAIEGKLFLLAVRHSGHSFRDLDGEGSLSINGSLLREGFPEDTDPSVLTSNSKQVVIGVAKIA